MKNSPGRGAGGKAKRSTIKFSFKVDPSLIQMCHPKTAKGLRKVHTRLTSCSNLSHLDNSHDH